MSRVSKWKVEKTKVKVVFRLQFHAAHIPQTGWDKLFISFIPADSGKPTAKTSKANVRNGTCKWGDPIYETTRLLQDSKSKLYDEKLYKLVVSMGSSRASTLGEATINLADYVDALKPSTVALPLQGCNYGTILHITVQLLTSKTGFREFEQQRELRERGLQSGAESHGQSATGKSPYSYDVTNDLADKVNERIKLKQDASDLASFNDEGNLNEESANSATGFDGSSHTSESLYAEKHESAHEFDSHISAASGDVGSLSHSSCTVKEDPPNHQNLARESTGFAQSWISDNSIENELVMACKENNRLRESLEVAESSFLDLKLEVSSLQSLTDELGAETQKLSHLLAAEIASSENLGKEVTAMKSECQKLKDDITRIKELKDSISIPVAERTDNHANDLVRNMQHQFLNGIAVMESKIRELQKKVFVFPHNGDTKFIYSELEALLNFLLDFKLGNGEVKALLSVLPSEIADVRETREPSMYKDEHFASGNGLGLDLCQPEGILQHFSLNSAVSEVNPIGAIDAMKGQIFDLVRELDEAKVEKEAFNRKMHQMECYYEALVQELEENQKRLLGELQHLRNEHSTCVYTLSSSRAEIESLREDMNQQMRQFVEERHGLEALNKELEIRATTSEAALRRARLNYSIAVDKLQKDLELLSSQVMSMFETNENLIKQALPSQPHSQNDLKVLQYPEDVDVRKPLPSQNENLALRKRSVGGDVLLEDLKRSFFLQEELYQNVEKELIEMYSVNLNLDIYSKSLQESLHEADGCIRTMKAKMNELVEELELSMSSQNQLMTRLQKATDDIDALNELKSSSMLQCSDMALQNQFLEDKLVMVSKENYQLAQKLKDCESSMMECMSYQTKYEACLAENAELSLKVKHEVFENEKLTQEVSVLKEKLTVLKSESDELVSLKESLEGNFSFVHDKLCDLLESCEKNLHLSAGSNSPESKDMDIKDVVLQLGKVQRTTSAKICQLMEENQTLRRERDVSDVSLSTIKLEILALKQKFKNGIEDIVAKMDVSNALVDKFQVELESVASKLMLSFEIEEKYTQQSEVLLADLALLENQMRELTCKDGYFAQDTLGLDALEEELGRSESTIAELRHDKHELTMSLQSKAEEAVKLSGEIIELKEQLKNFQDRLDKDKMYKEELETKVRDLASDLDRHQNEVLVSEQQKAELSMFLQEKSEKCIKISNEISFLREEMKHMHDALQDVKSYNCELEAKVGDLASHLEMDQDKLLMFEREKAELAMLLHGKSEESDKLSRELSCLKDNLKILHEELHAEKVSKDELEVKVGDLTSHLRKEQESSLNLQQQEAELMHVRKLVSDLELEKSKLSHLLSQQNDFIGKLKATGSCQASLESQLIEMYDYSLVADIKLVYLTSQCGALFGELTLTLVSSEGCVEELEKRCHDAEEELNHYYAREANWREEKTNLLISHVSLKSDLEAYEAHNKLLSDSNIEMRGQLEECNCKLTAMETEFSLNLVLQAFEVEWMNTMMKEAEEDMNYLAASKEELAILVITLKGKVDELSAQLPFLQVYKDELQIIRLQCTELSRKLSEQILKTEELKNLSSHLKELKDKAEAECLVACEKRETDVTPVAANDSLRIAFIKEQYETKVQELKQQLSVSKKHGEEMLMKLQDAINEIETRKKSEAVNMKRNEELSVILSALESELQSAIAEKREKSNAYDRTKAELECALLSLECCREEKEKLGSSLLEYEAEKSQLSIELSSLKEQLVNEKEKLGSSLLEYEAEKSQLSIELSLVKEQLENLKSSTIKMGGFGRGTEVEHELNGSSRNSLPVFFLQNESTLSLNREIADSTQPAQLHSVQDVAHHRFHRNQETPSTKEFLGSNGKSLDVDKENLGVQSIRSSLEHLHDELEKMKNENSVFSIHHDANPGFQVPQKEIMQLHKANEELQSMFPLFNEIASGGNALERVLALEIELAEALKTKNKSSVQFQSSFLKQHSDEESVFRSFKDINELINEMLKLRGKHTAMEAELREMHDRYSQLSLQFAEVEGERQKLKMTLKNVRSGKLANLNQSSSGNITDQLS